MTLTLSQKLAASCSCILRQKLILLLSASALIFHQDGNKTHLLEQAEPRLSAEQFSFNPPGNQTPSEAAAPGSLAKVNLIRGFAEFNGSTEE